MRIGLMGVLLGHVLASRRPLLATLLKARIEVAACGMPDTPAAGRSGGAKPMTPTRRRRAMAHRAGIAPRGRWASLSPFCKKSPHLPSPTQIGAIPGVEHGGDHGMPRAPCVAPSTTP
jgi:hypothetical protein